MLVEDPHPAPSSSEMPVLDEDAMLVQLDGIITEYATTQGALIPILQMAQSLFGYLPDPVLQRIAARLGKSFSEVAGVVGFYSFFSRHPQGRHQVRVCLGTACYVRRGKEVLAAMKKELGIEIGQSTPDRCFSLEVGRCFGACGLAPVVMVGVDVHQGVKPAKVRQLLADYTEEAETSEQGGQS